MGVRLHLSKLLLTLSTKSSSQSSTSKSGLRNTTWLSKSWISNKVSALFPIATTLNPVSYFNINSKASSINACHILSCEPGTPPAQVSAVFNKSTPWLAT